MTKEDADKIKEWITQNADKESVFLTPVPRWNVDAHELLDFLYSLVDKTDPN